MLSSQQPSTKLSANCELLTNFNKDSCYQCYLDYCDCRKIYLIRKKIKKSWFNVTFHFLLSVTTLSKTSLSRYFLIITFSEIIMIS